jgi:hypothetical protein
MEYPSEGRKHLSDSVLDQLFGLPVCWKVSSSFYRSLLAFLTMINTGHLDFI